MEAATLQINPTATTERRMASGVLHNDPSGPAHRHATQPSWLSEALTCGRQPAWNEICSATSDRHQSRYNRNLYAPAFV
jgi:hypothetical protein